MPSKMISLHLVILLTLLSIFFFYIYNEKSQLNNKMNHDFLFNFYSVDATASLSSGTSDGSSKVIIVVNEPPIPRNNNLEMDEDTSTDIQLTFVDRDNIYERYDLEIVDGPSNGELTKISEIDNQGQGNYFAQYKYIPNTNFFGTDVLTFQADDGIDKSEQIGIVTITVNPINDPPVTVDLGQKEILCIDKQKFVLKAEDVDNNKLSFDVSQPQHGKVIEESNGDNSLIVNYVPEKGYHGSDSFTFSVNDGNSLQQDSNYLNGGNSSSSSNTGSAYLQIYCIPLKLTTQFEEKEFFAGENININIGKNSIFEIDYEIPENCNLNEKFMNNNYFPFTNTFSNSELSYIKENVFKYSKNINEQLNYLFDIECEFDYND